MTKLKPALMALASALLLPATVPAQIPAQLLAPSTPQAAPAPNAAASAAADAQLSLRAAPNFNKRAFEPSLGDYYSNHEAAMRFADTLAAKNQLDAETVRAVLGQARFSPSAQRLMRPSEAGFFKNWRVYRSRFVEPIRINAGLRFWRQNRDALERAETEFGVPVEVILGIIGVETIYGRDMGSFRVIDTLATLAFDFPKTEKRDRSAFFQDELATFLLLQLKNQADPFEVRGSYAGAIGMGQFMPSSIRSFAVDYDGDGVIDLSHSATDVIGSVANYFKSYGWKRGAVATFNIQFDPQTLDLDHLLAPDILPTFRPAQMQAKGVILPPTAEQYPGPLALIELMNGDPAVAGNEKEYLAGTENFYTITRYNQSSYYAMAVLDLGAAIREQAGF